MKNTNAIIACAASLAVGITLSAAQPAPPPTPPTPAPPALPAPVAMAEEAYQPAIAVYGQAGASGAGRALIIPREAGDAKEFADMEEDLNVMARILEKATAGRDGKHPYAMGITVQTSVFGSSSAPKNLYIEGHGALFFLNVNFPLLAPATKGSDADAKEKTSTEWDEARRELHQGRGTGFFEFKTPTFGAPAEEYDADKVEDLKRDVTDALKNATHIRGLNSDETITVVISGRGGSGESRLVRRSAGSGGGSGGRGGGATALARSSGGDSRGTKLILRARKADIDAVQKENLSAEDFRKKVTIIVY